MESRGDFEALKLNAIQNEKNLIERFRLIGDNSGNYSPVFLFSLLSTALADPKNASQLETKKKEISSCFEVVSQKIIDRIALERLAIAKKNFNRVDFYIRKKDALALRSSDLSQVGWTRERIEAHQDDKIIISAENIPESILEVLQIDDKNAVDDFNDFNRFIHDNILNQSTTALEVIYSIELWIRVAEKSFELGDYVSVKSICSVLNAEIVGRFFQNNNAETEYKLISNRSQEIFKRFYQITKQDSTSKGIERDCLLGDTIPYVGLFKSDFDFASQGKKVNTEVIQNAVRLIHYSKNSAFPSETSNQSNTYTISPQEAWKHMENKISAQNLAKHFEEGNYLDETAKLLLDFASESYQKEFYNALSRDGKNQFMRTLAPFITTENQNIIALLCEHDVKNKDEIASFEKENSSTPSLLFIDKLPFQMLSMQLHPIDVKTLEHKKISHPHISKKTDFSYEDNVIKLRGHLQCASLNEKLNKHFDLKTKNEKKKARASEYLKITSVYGQMTFEEKIAYLNQVIENGKRPVSRFTEDEVHIIRNFKAGLENKYLLCSGPVFSTDSSQYKFPAAKVLNEHIESPTHTGEKKRDLAELKQAFASNIKSKDDLAEKLEYLEGIIQTKMLPTIPFKDKDIKLLTEYKEKLLKKEALLRVMTTLREKLSFQEKIDYLNTNMKIVEICHEKVKVEKEALKILKEMKKSLEKKAKAFSLVQDKKKNFKRHESVKDFGRKFNNLNRAPSFKTNRQPLQDSISLPQYNVSAMSPLAPLDSKKGISFDLLPSLPPSAESPNLQPSNVATTPKVSQAVFNFLGNLTRNKRGSLVFEKGGDSPRNSVESKKEDISQKRGSFVFGKTEETPSSAKTEQSTPTPSPEKSTTVVLPSKTLARTISNKSVMFQTSPQEDGKKSPSRTTSKGTLTRKNSQNMERQKQIEKLRKGSK